MKDDKECAFCEHYQDEHTELGCAVEECVCINFLEI